MDGINVYYGNIHAVKDISFTVNAGEIVTLIGANGAGKSTTLKTISGLLKPRTGDVLYKGKSIKGVRAHKIVESGLGVRAHIKVLVHCHVQKHMADTLLKVDGINVYYGNIHAVKDISFSNVSAMAQPSFLPR